MPLVPLLDTGIGYKSRTVSMQLRKNLYCEINKNPDKDQITMYGTPGSVFTNSLSDVIRGAVTVGNVAYVVAGKNVWRHDAPSNFTLISIAAIATATGRVSMASNGAQVLIVDGAAGYILTIATGITIAIADVDFPNGATTCCFLNGYFIVEKPNTGQFWWSDIYNGLSWNALQFATAESNPDNLVAVAADHGTLILFGERTTEFWGPSGTTTVFQRIGAAGIEWGLGAKFSYDRFSDNSIFLAQNRMGEFQLVQLQGFNAVPIESPDVIHDMNLLIKANGFASLSSVTAFTFMLDNHPMYQINFPQKSYMYDGKSDAWNEMTSWDDPIDQFNRHFADVHWVIAGDSYCSNYRSTLSPADPSFGASGFVYRLDANVYHDNFNIIEREWTPKHIFADLDRMTIKEFFIECESATALIPPGIAIAPGFGPGQGQNPMMSLTWSKDGGATWGNQISQPMGLLGNYLTRCVWRMLGRCRDFVFKMRITEPVKVVITNAGMIVE